MINVKKYESGIDMVSKMKHKSSTDMLQKPFNVLQNVEAFSQSDKIQDLPSREDAFATLMKYSRSLLEDFDYKAELEAAREGNAESAL